MTTSDPTFSFSPEFVKACKLAFPDDRELHQALDHNDLRTGNILTQAIVTTNTPALSADDPCNQELIDLTEAPGAELMAMFYNEWVRYCVFYDAVELC